MKKIAVTLLILLSITFMPLVAYQPAYAAGSCNDKDIGFLGFPTWYRGLANVSDPANPTECTLKTPAELNSPGKEDGLSNYIWHIVINVIDILIMAIGYISVGFILYGGFQYLTSAGNAENIKKGKTTIINAVIGLVLSLVAVAIINLVFTLWV